MKYKIGTEVIITTPAMEGDHPAFIIDTDDITKEYLVEYDTLLYGGLKQWVPDFWVSKATD